MKFELVFEGDTISAYLDKLYEVANDPRRKEQALSGAATDVVELVDEYVPKWNPNLRYSGLNEEFWEYTHSEDYSDVMILYTGFTGEGVSEPDDIAVWWEFSRYHKGGYSDILGRDYAYYQEFGEDKFAPNGKLKAPNIPGKHYLEAGIMGSEDIIEYHIENYLERVMSLK